MIKDLDLFLRQLLDIGRSEQFDQHAKLPGSYVRKDVIRLAGIYRHDIVKFMQTLSVIDQAVFVKAIAVYENTVGGLGSVTMLNWLFPVLNDPERKVLEWVLRNTTSYGWYSPAKSLQEHDDMIRYRAERAAESKNLEIERQARDRNRIAAKATSNLYNAVRRGDIKAVRALLVKGADASAQSPDGTSLIVFARSRQRKDIADELNSGNLV